MVDEYQITRYHRKRTPRDGFGCRTRTTASCSTHQCILCFDAEGSHFPCRKGKKPNNRYTAKPKGLEHLNLEKTEDPSIAEFASGGAGFDAQDAAAAQVRDAKRTKRALHEEGMASTAGKERFTPQLKAQESSDDRFTDSMTAYFLADTLKTKQEALSLLDERKNKKMDHIERLQRMMASEKEDEMKEIFRKQIKNALKSLATLEAEEQVRM